MPQVSKEDFTSLLTLAIENCIQEVQREIIGDLPSGIRLRLEGFGQNKKDATLDEIVSYLYQDGTFPRIVDIAVRGIKGDAVLVWIRPSGHAFVRSFSETWNTPDGMGPFKSVGLMLPGDIWNRSRPHTLSDLAEAGKKWEL